MSYQPPASAYPPPPPSPASQPTSWRRRAAIPLVAALVAAATAGVTVTLLRDAPPPLPEVAVAAPETEPEPEPEPEPVELSAQELAEEYGPAVWKVEVDGCGVEASGSAFAIDETTLITNWHVVVIDPTPTLVHRDGTTRVQGTVIGWTEQPDVAVITVDEPVDDWMEFTDASELTEGQTLVGLGYPAPATDFTVTSSSILSFQTDGDVRQAIRADGLLDKGNSGGPVLTSSGQVAGVVTEMADNSTGLQLVPLAYTYEHLHETIDQIIDAPADLEPDCDAAGLRPDLPDDWEIEPLPAAGGDYGDDPEFDRLWDLCADEDWDACDELYWNTPVGSGYEAFGASCGDREEWYGSCAAFMGSDEQPADSGRAETYGDDATLDQLWDLCDDGDMVACDDLYLQTPYGSRYEAYGSTCGDRQDATFGNCAEDASATSDASTLRSLCADGDMSACDELYYTTPYGSDDEDFGATCGGREASWRAGSCTDRDR